MEWLVTDTGKKTGRENMDFDLQLLNALRHRRLPPVLRFYQWQPPAVSLGAGQVVTEEVNMAYCRQQNIPVVHRPSGGGAIFHEDELTYSFAAHRDDFPAFHDLLTSYYTIVAGLQRGLERLGVSAQVRGGTKSSRPERFQPCFSLASRHDLVFQGKKLLGSAQKRRQEAFLQHGSLPFSFNRPLVEKIFRQPDGFFLRATSLAEIMGRRPEEGEVRKALVCGMETAFNRKFRVASPDELQQLLAG